MIRPLSALLRDAGDAHRIFRTLQSRCEWQLVLENVLYQTVCTAALMWAMFVLVGTATVVHPDWTISTLIAEIEARHVVARRVFEGVRDFPMNTLL